MLPRRKLRVIVFEAREQVTVDVESHLDGAVPEERLDALGREAPLDRPGCEKMAERVHTVFRLACRVDDASLGLQSIKASVGNVGVALDIARAVREYQPLLPLRTDEAPFPQRVDHHG